MIHFGAWRRTHAAVAGLAGVLVLLMAMVVIPRLGPTGVRAPQPHPAVPVEPLPQITNSIGMKLVLIPPGEFLMGSSKDLDEEAQDEELPQHRVRITRPFYLGVTEVTQGQYRAVTGQNPSNFKGSDDLSVESVSWLDATNFCNAVSRAEGLTPFYQVDGQNVSVPDWKGAGYRLPTEAEWEYACRAKNPARYSFGDDPAGLGEHAWSAGNSGHKTHPVGQKRPNGFGRFDMHGNVNEWCWDGFDPKYYAESPVDDPRSLRGLAPYVSRRVLVKRPAGRAVSVPELGSSGVPERLPGVPPGPSSVWLMRAPQPSLRKREVRESLRPRTAFPPCEGAVLGLRTGSRMCASHA